MVADFLEILKGAFRPLQAVQPLLGFTGKPDFLRPGAIGGDLDPDPVTSA